MKVLPGDALPGELLVQASEAAVVTSTLVLGCLFSMVGAQPEDPPRRRKAKGDPPGASAGVHRGARLLAGAPTSAPTVTAAAAFAPSVISSSVGNSDHNGDSNVGSGSNGTNSSNGSAGGRSDNGDVGGQACGSQSTGAPVVPGPEDLGCGGSIGQDNSDQGLGGGLGGSFAGRGSDGGRSDGLGGGGAARDGYGGGGGRRDGYGGGGGWPGFGAGGADDGGAAPSPRIAFALCIALGTAAALLTQKADRLLAGPRDPKALHHRLPPQLHELSAEQPVQQRPPPLDTKEGKEPLQRCTRQARGLSEILEEQQAQQQWERMREHQSQQQEEQQQQEQQQQSQWEQQPNGMVEGMAAQIDDSARLFSGRLILACAAAGAAAAASGVALRIHCRDFGNGRCTRSHSIGVGTAAAAASLADLDGPWPGFPTLELDLHGGYPIGGSQLKPKQPAAAPHTQPGQQGSRRPPGGPSYGVKREGDVLECDSGQQPLTKPARQQVDHQGMQQQGARSGPRGSDVGSDSSSRGRSNHGGSGGGSSAAEYPPERHAAEAPKPVRKGLVVGRETPPSYFHGYRGGQQTPSAPDWLHGEQPGMQQPVATRPGPRGCNVGTDTSQSHSNQSGSDLGASGSADRTHERRKVEIPQPVRSGLVFGHEAPSGDDYGSFSKQQPLPARQQHERPEVQQTATRPAPPVCGVGSGGGSSQGSSADIQDCTLERADTEAPRSVRRGLVGRETPVGSLEGCCDGQQTPSAPTWQYGEQPRTPQLATRPGPRGCDVGHGRRHDSSNQNSSDQGSNGGKERTLQHRVAETPQPARRALVFGRGAPSGDDYGAFGEQRPLPATQQPLAATQQPLAATQSLLPATQQALPAKQQVEVPAIQQKATRSGPRGSDVGSDSSSRDRSNHGGSGGGSSAAEYPPERHTAEAPKPVRKGLVVGRETPYGIGIGLLQRRRGRARQPGGPESAGSPLPPQSAVAVPVPVPASVQAPTQRPMAALRPELAPAPEPRLADKAVEAPGRTALTVAVAPFPLSRGPVDVGRAVSAVLVRCPPGGGAGGLAAVSLCDEIAALGTLQRGLDGAQRRADLWLAFGVPGLPGAAAAAAVAHT